MLRGTNRNLAASEKFRFKRKNIFVNGEQMNLTMVKPVKG